MKNVFRLVILAFAAMTSTAPVSRGEVVYHAYGGDCACIDFDGNGVEELSFSVFAIGHELGGVIFLSANGPTNSQVLAQNNSAVPLKLGDAISAATSPGQWSGTGFGISIWQQQFNSGVPIVIIGPGGQLITNLPPPAPPGEGVGMPGFGNFFGARFLLADGVHYGWVRLGVSGSEPLFSLPGIWDFAYETSPDTRIVAGAGLDGDEDGVPDLVDQCPNTSAGDAVNSAGCSISQIVPCDGPWKNHGDYVKSVGMVARDFAAEGLITQAQLRAVNRDAAASDCGKNHAQPQGNQPSGGKGQSKHKN